MFRSGAVTGKNFKHKHSKRSGSCDSCMKGKQTKQTLSTNISRSEDKCAVINSGVCGPMSVQSFSDARYFVFFIDGCTGHMVLGLIPRKSDVLREFKLYQVWLERQFDCSVKRVRISYILSTFVTVESTVTTVKSMWLSRTTSLIWASSIPQLPRIHQTKTPLRREPTACLWIAQGEC